jgi:8-oxo-dGTP pyrophosphatase MutT (NUDIX family)
MTVDAVTWRNSRPAKRMGAGALIRDERGRVLLVEPTYQDSWEIPGGSVEADESPRAACARELEEELGIRSEVGRLLCLEWQGPEPDRTESMMLVYDGGILTDPSVIRLPPGELASYRFVELDELDGLLVERLSRRLRAAARALADGGVAELEHGVLVRHVAPPEGAGLQD